jgi:hypothetical protein
VLKPVTMHVRESWSMTEMDTFLLNGMGRNILKNVYGRVTETMRTY